MKLLQHLLIFSVAFLVNSASEDIVPEVDITTASSVTSSQVTEPTNLTTAAETTVTIEPITNTTAAVTTVTIQPITDTTASPATESTTPAVVSTTTTESPGPADLMLVVNNSVNACIIAKLEITLSLEYMNTNESMVIGTFPITSATVDSVKSSNCANPAKEEEENLYADFNGNNSLRFLFNHTSTNKFAVTLFQLNTEDLSSFFPDAQINQTLNLQSNGSIFETSSNMSYKCNSETKVDLVDMNMMATNHSITFKMVQVEAFRTTADSNFANAIDCEADDEIDNIVPIAVGCALAGLVVIVLIAYLVGRRQKRQRGYESV